RGLNSATAAIHGGLGDWGTAIPFLYRALEGTPVGAHRDRHLYLCVLLHAQIEAGAWRDAETTVDALVPLIGMVGSARPFARLTESIDHIRKLPRRPPR